MSFRNGYTVKCVIFICGKHPLSVFLQIPVCLVENDWESSQTFNLKNEDIHRGYSQQLSAQKQKWLTSRVKVHAENIDMVLYITCEWKLRHLKATLTH